MIVLQIDFPSSGPFGEQMSAVFADLAHDIAQETGLIWKIWTENEQEQSAGSIYLFSDEALTRQYSDRRTARLQSFGLTDIRSKMFTVNEHLSAINGFALPS